MINSRLASFILFAFLFGLGKCACAGVVITVGDGTAKKFMAGTNVLLPVFATNNLSNAVTVSSFALGFDISPTPNTLDGAVIPAGFSNYSFTSSLFTQTPAALAPTTTGRNYDIVLSANASPSFSFSSGSTIQLGTVSFNASLETTPGQYGFTFVPNAKRNSTLINAFSPFVGNITNGGQFSSGSGTFRNYFEIQEIPEPSTMALIALGLTGGAAYRRLRKRSPSKAPGTPGS